VTYLHRSEAFFFVYLRTSGSSIQLFLFFDLGVTSWYWSGHWSVLDNFLESASMSAEPADAELYRTIADIEEAFEPEGNLLA